LKIQKVKRKKQKTVETGFINQLQNAESKMQKVKILLTSAF
jgi:hypothetical protein